MTEDEACTRFVRWLDERVLKSARGDDIDTISVEPRGLLWLGRLAPEMAAVARGLGDRGERLDPCAIGIRVQPTDVVPIEIEVEVRARVWLFDDATRRWTKSPPLAESLHISIAAGDQAHGADQLAQALAAVVGGPGLTSEIRTELTTLPDGNRQLVVELVNTSPDDSDDFDDTNLYQCRLSISRFATRPFMLESLPDSFRYDRRVPAYGINCGVRVTDGGGFETTDTVVVDRGRPRYWNVPTPEPDMSFAKLASDPIPVVEALAIALADWGDQEWAPERLEQRALAESWSEEMRAEAERGAQDFRSELARIRNGVELLRTKPDLRRAFCGMNDAIRRSAAGRYDRWRPFQLGFLLANLACITSPEEESRVADIVWFATGGGKTETYLGIIVTAALYDRFRGKKSGITAWSRFPLRMLSLQQTQRFADAMAAAELVRREQKLEGDPFSVGFLVGNSATPNAIKPNPKSGDPDPDDDSMPAKYRVLMRCPFCRSEALTMAFNRRIWRLEHRCGAAECSWGSEALPFYVVDEEIYRFLPTILVGTLDKAATISMQASMRGLVGAPWGRCSIAGHGFTYAPRSARPNGCLVPDCRGTAGPLDMTEKLFPPTMRLQDELHLLRDSLGAVDAHYEALFDHLQEQLTGTRAKILGSSATLAGYQKQMDVLYQRDARVFPALGPSATTGFWTTELGQQNARRFVALAPRGVTVEYAVDRALNELQASVRQLRDNAATVCQQAGIDERWAPRLLSLYGVDVVYGNTLRDLEAATRSFETQIRVNGPLHTASLTGRTPFDEVRNTLDRLDKPEGSFDDRLHVIAASAMMSHGVDVDRLNVMLMLGLPLTTAEFIQTSARVGRRYPGIVLVMPKMARERDASVFRSFEHFVRQGDRLVEPIPITRRSRRVLERTLPGLFMARVRQILEPQNGDSLVTTDRLRTYVRDAGITSDTEFEALRQALGLEGGLDEALREDLKSWLEQFFENLGRVAGAPTFPDELSPTEKPMTSLRDVEEQAPVYGSVPR